MIQNHWLFVSLCLWKVCSGTKMISNVNTVMSGSNLKTFFNLINNVTYPDILAHGPWTSKVRPPKIRLVLVMDDLPSTGFWVHLTLSPSNYGG